MLKREALYGSLEHSLDPVQTFNALWNRAKRDRDFKVVASFVITGLLASLYLIAFCPWSTEIAVALSALS